MQKQRVQGGFISIQKISGYPRDIEHYLVLICVRHAKTEGAGWVYDKNSEITGYPRGIDHLVWICVRHAKTEGAGVFMSIQKICGYPRDNEHYLVLICVRHAKTEGAGWVYVHSED